MKSDKRKQQYKQLGLAVAYYRKMHGLTQLQLAEECESEPHPHQQPGGSEHAHQHFPGSALRHR